MTYAVSRRTLSLQVTRDTTELRSASEAHGLTPKAFVDQNLAWLVFGWGQSCRRGTDGPTPDTRIPFWLSGYAVDRYRP